MRRVPRRLRSVPEWASCSDNYLAYGQPAGGYQYGIPYQINQIALEQFGRARAIARNYQEFRIKKVTVRWTPFYDTFIAPNVGATQIQSVPKLYYMIDKRGAIPNNFTMTTLARMGATPKRLDDKTISVSWKPGVMSVANESVGTAPVSFATGKVSISPWLPVNEQPNSPATVINTSTTNHLGLSFMVVCDVNTLLTQDSGLYNVELICDFEFRKPTYASASDVSAVQLVGGLGAYDDNGELKLPDQGT